MHIKHKKHQVEEFDKQLAVEQSKLERDARREEVQQQLEMAIQAKEAKINAHKQALVDLGGRKDAATTAQAELQGLQEPMKRNKDKLQGIDDQIDQLKQIAEKGGLAIFHRNMPRLVQQVQAANWYGEKPVGPLGQYVKLKNPVWAPALRAMIGWTMHAWAVTTERDRTQLHRMFKEHGMYVLRSMVLLPFLISSQSGADHCVPG
jgi:chromosome segregation ATPase